MTTLMHSLRNITLQRLLRHSQNEKIVENPPSLVDDESFDTMSRDRPFIIAYNFHDYAVLTDLSSHRRTAYEGWGVVEDDATGVPVTVMEVTSSVLDQVQGDGRSYAVHLGRELQRYEIVQDSSYFLHLYRDAKYVANQTGRSASSWSEDGTGEQIVTERLDGWSSLSQLLKKRGYLGSFARLQVVRYWGRQILMALGVLHSRGLLLRNLHPDVIFVSPDGRHIKITSLEQAGTIAVDGTLEGRLVEGPDICQSVFRHDNSYIPPEAAKVDAGDGTYSITLDSHVARVTSSTTAWDTWQFGALLFEMVFGRPPPAYADQLDQFLRQQQVGAKVRQTQSESQIAELFFYDFFEAIGCCNDSTAQSASAYEGRNGELLLQRNVTNKEGNNSTAVSRALQHALAGKSLSVLLPHLVVAGFTGETVPAAGNKVQ